MGGRFASQTTGTLLGTLAANSSEVAILTTGPVILLDDNAMVLVAWGLAFTVAASCNAVTVIIRRGAGILGQEIIAGAETHDVVGSKSYFLGGASLDQPGPGALAYTLSVTQTGASVAGTITDGTLITAVF